MAETPPINITIDEDALRTQVQRVIRQELDEIAAALFRASYDLSPAFHKEREDEMESYLRGQWEAEQEPAPTPKRSE